MRLCALLVVALVFAAAAAAKGPVSASVCGVSGCRVAAEPQLLNPIDGHSFALASAPRPAPYFVAILSAPGEFGFCWRLVWVPKRRLLRVENLGAYRPGAPVAGRYWRSVHPQLARSLARGFRGLAPYAPARAWKGPAGPCTA